MDPIEALQARALDAVLHPDHDAFIRHVFRWYARNLATPYHDVADLPLEEVLQAYFEGIFEQLPYSKQIEEARTLSMNDAERRAHQRWLEAEAAADELFAKEAEQLQEQQLRAKAIRDARAAEAERKTAEANPTRITVKRGKIPELEDVPMETQRPLSAKPKEVAMPNPTEALPDIQMSFGTISDEELEQAGGLQPPEE